MFWLRWNLTHISVHILLFLLLLRLHARRDVFQSETPNVSFLPISHKPAQSHKIWVFIDWTSLSRQPWYQELYMSRCLWSVWIFLWRELHILNLPVGLFVFVEIGFYDHCSTAVCLNGHQQVFILLLAQPDKIAHMHTQKCNFFNFSVIFQLR